MTNRLLSPELMPGRGSSVTHWRGAKAAPATAQEFLIPVRRNKFRWGGFALIRALAAADAVNLIRDQFSFIRRLGAPQLSQRKRPAGVFAPCCQLQEPLQTWSWYLQVRREQTMHLHCQYEHKYTGIPPNKHAVCSCGAAPVISEAGMFVYYLYFLYRRINGLSWLCECAHLRKIHLLGYEPH